MNTNPKTRTYDLHSESVSQFGLQLFEPQVDALYNLDTTALLVGAPRRSILVYCRWGMEHPEVDETYGGWYFDAAAIRALRRIEYLRTVQGINLVGIRMIMALLEQLEHSRAERRFQDRL